MKKKVYSKLIYCILGVILFAFTVSVSADVTGKIWKPLPLRTQAQAQAGMPGGEGMQMGFGISYAPSKANIAYLVTDTEQVWRGEWKQLGGIPGYPDFQGFYWQSKRSGFRSNGGISLVVDPLNENVVFVSGSSHQTTTDPSIDGIYRTLNGGDTWELVHQTRYYRNHEGQHFVFDLRKCETGRCMTVYAGTHTAGILKSTDGGSTWTALNILNNIHISDLEINLDMTNNTVILYVATNDISVSSKGLYKVTDDGVNPVTIAPLGNLPDYPRTIALNPQSDPAQDIIYAAVGNYRVYKSTNGGQTFQEKSTGLPSLNPDQEYKVININTSDTCINGPGNCLNGDYLYVSIDQHGNNPYYSHDGGETWEMPSSLDEDNLSLTQGVWFASAVAPHPDYKDVALINFAGASRISETIDGGRNWSYSGNGFMGAARSRNKTSAYFGPNGGNIFFLLDWGPAVTYDDGNTWELMPVPRYSGSKSTPVGAVDLRDLYNQTDDIIIAPVGTTSSQVIARTDDSGDSWTMFDGVGPDTTFKDHNNIIHTLHHSDPDTRGNYRFISFVSDSNYVYAGTWQAGISWKSTDKGASWSKIIDIDIDIGEIRAVSGDIVYAFEDYTTGAPANCGTGFSKLWRSDDKGKTWLHLTVNPFKAAQIYDVDIDPLNTDRLYVAKQGWGATGNGGFWVFDGNIWQTTGETKSCICDNGVCQISDSSINEPIEREYGSPWVNAVVVDPNNPGVVYIGMSSGYGHRQEYIYRSTDYGMTWENINLAAYSKVHSLAIETVNTASGMKSILHMSTAQGNYVLCTDEDDDEYAVEGGVCGEVDCNDNNPAIHPGATEVCDGIDNDCDGFVDNDLTAPLNDLQAGVCSGSTKTCNGAGGWINDYSNVANYEAAEVTCDGLDNDCDGIADEFIQGSFQEPINGDGSSIFKLNRIIPVKIKLSDCGGQNVSTATVSISKLWFSNAPEGTPIEVESPGNADTDNFFRYDAESEQYIYNLSTQGYSPGKYEITAHLNDGQSHSITFSLKEP